MDNNQQNQWQSGQTYGGQSQPTQNSIVNNQIPTYKAPVGYGDFSTNQAGGFNQAQPNQNQQFSQQASSQVQPVNNQSSGQFPQNQPYQAGAYDPSAQFQQNQQAQFNQAGEAINPTTQMGPDGKPLPAPAAKKPMSQSSIMIIVTIIISLLSLGVIAGSALIFFK